MEPEMDFVSKLMENDPGGRSFFASCLLCLNPEELKACRLVNPVWAKFIMDEVWKRSMGRKRLEGKLVERWKAADPRTVELVQTRERVYSMYCNDAYVFCGLPSSKVVVYSFTTGQWLRDLNPGKVKMGHSSARVSGSKTVVAAALRDSTVTVWSSQGRMEQLYYFDATNLTCLDTKCHHFRADHTIIRAINVVGSKIVLLVHYNEKNKGSLVVISKGANNWEEKTLTCFPCFPSPTLLHLFLATDRDWISVSDSPQRRVTLWQDDTYRQDIDLSGCLSDSLIATAMDLPFFILSVRDYVKHCACIKVFRLAADNEMKDISTVASLVKSIPLGDFWPRQRGIICNQLFFGFVNLGRTGMAVTLIEKRAVVDAAVAEAEMRQIILTGSIIPDCVDMNSTSLVFAQFQGEFKSLGFKKDFWMANSTL